MTTQVALLITLFLVTVLALLSTFFVREPDGVRKSKPYYYIFYSTGLVLYIVIGNIPNFNSDYYAIFLDFVFGVFIGSLSIGVCIRYENNNLERLSYILLFIYMAIILIIQPYFKLNGAVNFILMLLLSLVIIISIVKRKPKPNKADYGLSIILSLWTILSVYELISPEVGDHMSYFFSDYMIYMMILFPTTMFGIAIFLLGSYLLDSNTKLEKLATLDELTGMLNRRAFFDRIDLYINLLGRSDKLASVIITDIDKFKNINDTYGHETGDEVIKAFATIIKESVRESDISARYGGEEFLIFVPDSNVYQTKILAERLRANAEVYEVKCGNIPVSFTASFGIANYQLDKEPTISINKADQALYHAKNNGRNMVSIYGETIDT